MRGVYIVANDKVGENAIALMSSLRLRDPDIPVFLIPFNDDHKQVAQQLADLYNVQLFPDLDFLNALWCDYHYTRGLEDVFSEVAPQQNIFDAEALKDVFNSGLWGSRKSALSLEQLYDILSTCAAHKEYFDFSSGCTDQPIMNYLVLKAMPRRLNIVKANPGEPGSWGGTPHFERRDDVLFDGDKPLRYLHWAGTPMRAGGPYRNLWTHYRYLNDPEGKALAEANKPAPPSTFEKLTRRVKNRLRAVVK